MGLTVGLVVEGRILPEELRCPRYPQKQPVNPGCLKKTSGQLPSDRRYNTLVSPDLVRFFVASLRLWSRLALMSKPGLYTRAV